MRVIKADLAQPLMLGKQGEYGVTQIVFDLSGYIKTYGNGVAQLTVKRPGDPMEYAAAVEQTATEAVWEIGAEWTENAGQGRCQLSWLPTGRGVAKSDTYQTHVSEAMGASGNDAPEPQSGYLIQIQTAGAQAIVAANKAQEALGDTLATAKRFDIVVAQTTTLIENAADETKEAADVAAASARVAVDYSEHPPIVGDNGKWWVWNGNEYRDSGVAPSEGVAGEDGGYYTPNVTQPSTDTMQVSYTPSAEGMPAVPSVSVTLPAGPAGVNGYTPQRGVDYYTEDDKAELVTAVVAALPVYNGEVEEV